MKAKISGKPRKIDAKPNGPDQRKFEHLINTIEFWPGFSERL